MTPTKNYPHITGVTSSEGETPTVLAVTSILTPSSAWPEQCRVIIGSPTESNEMVGRPGHVTTFSLSVEGAEQFIAILQRAVTDIREALGTARATDDTSSKGGSAP